VRSHFDEKDCTLQEKNTPEKTLWQKKTQRPNAGMNNLLKIHAFDNGKYPYDFIAPRMRGLRLANTLAKDIDCFPKGKQGGVFWRGLYG